MYEGVPFQLGTEGIGHLQFAQEMYSNPQPPLQILGVNNKDIELFVRDLPFNFALEQALQNLGDAGVLAKGARLCTIVGCIPIYAKLTRLVQELSEAVYKFQGGFNEKVRQLVTQLEATKGCMEAAQIRSCMHVALTKLT